MTKNLLGGIALIAVILGLGALFIQQQKSQKNPLENNPANSIIPAPTPTPAFKPFQSLPPAQTGQNSSQSGNIIIMPSGLKIQDIKIGEGQTAKTGDTIVVNYLGTLANGTKFDSSYDRNIPFETQIGIGKVIKGWDESIPGMKVDGKRKLIIPPELGYGEQGQGPIPPNSVLIFEVELLDIKQ